MNQPHDNDHHGAGAPPPFDPPPPPTGTAANGTSADQRQWAMFAHLSALTALFTGGLGAIIGPLVIWLIKKDTMPFVDDQGKEALNFNITMAVATLVLTAVGTVLLVILIGFLFYLAAFAVGVYWLVLTIIATIKANEGVAYRYPLTVRLIK
ncbi:DUF4870 domain-containing protein [Lysobacter sp. GX 14042]|uniref:DUF4870 domain-containing protein n=1 Tax=Lysobacter sp. GX 14042 TaxID=2907155 RepID=UPI001F403FEB|nr:DUF4870 domain-containing protein [Lysobacter sp. GX 14042]MCE7033152.1 DUF4870 domain-containing protein [Lysobacter sp. GX 14042]